MNLRKILSGLLAGTVMMTSFTAAVPSVYASSSTSISASTASGRNTYTTGYEDMTTSSVTSVVTTAPAEKWQPIYESKLAEYQKMGLDENTAYTYCEIDDNIGTISEGRNKSGTQVLFSGTIYGEKGSTAEAYANMHSRSFQALKRNSEIDKKEMYKAYSDKNRCFYRSLTYQE